MAKPPRWVRPAQRPSGNASPPAGAAALPEPITLRENPPAGPPPTFVAQAPAGDPAAAADLATATRLISRLNAQVPLSPEDVRDAEGLYARHPAEARDLLEGVLLAAAARAQAARRFDAAATLLQRAVTIAPESPRPLRMQLGLGLVTSDWPAAEQAGRALLALSPKDAEGARGLAYALVRQDRTREAVELLNGFLAATEDAEARALLARIQHDSAAEKSLSEAKLAHFHVRYDGEAHEDVGREILRLLDRHYATLARSFDHEPGQPIPVILLSRESYYDATGAPAWSGGQYDSFDGRVRIPIGGLSAALTPDLDQTLVHELTHSFVNDLSGGAAPRELHEGLAQYMEGRRIAQLDSDRLRALANGQLGGCRRLLLQLALAGGGPRRPAGLGRPQRPAARDGLERKRGPGLPQRLRQRLRDAQAAGGRTPPAALRRLAVSGPAGRTAGGRRDRRLRAPA